MNLAALKIKPAVILETERLRLRPWQASDSAPFAAMNGDERVMEFFPSVVTPEVSDGIMTRLQDHFNEYGWGFWAVELRATGEFIGFIGLLVPRPEIPAYPCVEVGWRLAAQHWHQGYATEGARASLDFAFDQLGLDHVVAFVVPENTPSRAVMHRLGMRDQHQPFIHPMMPEGSRFRTCCLYRINRDEWVKP